MSRYHKYCLILVCVGLCLIPLSADDVRDKSHQPERVMDLVGVRPGMIIGEVGAGHGFYRECLPRSCQTCGITQ
jgi:predicted methyltransferase